MKFAEAILRRFKRNKRDDEGAFERRMNDLSSQPMRRARPARAMPHLFVRRANA